MNFKKRKISKHAPKKLKIKQAEPKKLEASKNSKGKEDKKGEKTVKQMSIKIPIIISIVIIILLAIGIVKAVSNINFTVFLKVAGEELQKDTYGHTNFLVIGIGDKEHEGSDLTDTIIVASLDEESKLVTMMSIPRDLYIEDDEVGNSRINETFYHGKKYYDDEEKGFTYLKDKVEEVTGIEIHYWVKINFEGFKDLVDALGGIDIYVEESICDPYYPKDETFLYETFSIEEGMHHMDGETALKYARSRKTTSDFDRADRQQKIIYAIKEKALKTETILNQQKLKNLLNALKENIDTNIKIKEILTLGSMAEDFSKENINQRLIHDDPTKCGGFVYPPKPENYLGMFVLIPAGGFERIQQYADLNFNHPEIAQSNETLYILNGTPEYGIAGETKQVLQRFCFEITGFSNAADSDITETTYYYEQKYNGNGEPVESRPITLDFLQKVIPGKETTQIPEEYEVYATETDIIIELGSDYVDSDDYMLDSFYYIDSPIYSTNPFVNTNGAPTATTTIEITNEAQ